jgi:hypothetical protein
MFIPDISLNFLDLFFLFFGQPPPVAAGRKRHLGGRDLYGKIGMLANKWEDQLLLQAAWGQRNSNQPA